MNLRTIGARFAGTRQTYHYFVPDGDEPVIGDMIVTSVDYEVQPVLAGLANAPQADRDPLEGWLIPTAKLAIVAEVDTDQHPRANKFYVALIGAAALAKRQVADAAQLRTVQIQREARKELDALLAAEDKRQAYLRLAQTNPRAQELLRTIGEMPAVERPKGTSGRPQGWHDVLGDGKGKATAYNGNTDVDPQQVAPSPAPVASPFGSGGTLMDIDDD